jgi:hypothetical protein
VNFLYAYPYKVGNQLFPTNKPLDSFFETIVSEGDDDVAVEWAREVLEIFNSGQPNRLPTTYLNYAVGNESLESIYGYESWRLEKLRALKAKYDPFNRF